MTKLFFVRHGKTQWNLEGRYQGANGDSPLLPESLHEIDLLAAYLKKIQFAHLYSSPLPRAVTTAKKLLSQLAQPIPMTIEPNLREFNLGKMEGMTFNEVEKKYPAELHGFRDAPAEYDPSKIAGETFEQLVKRMRPAIVQAVKADQIGNENLLFVSHGAALVALIQSLLGIPIADWRKKGGLTNSSVTILETNDNGVSFQLIKWNETCFMDKKLLPSDTI